MIFSCCYKPQVALEFLGQLGTNLVIFCWICSNWSALKIGPSSLCPRTTQTKSTFSLFTGTRKEYSLNFRKLRRLSHLYKFLKCTHNMTETIKSNACTAAIEISSSRFYNLHVQSLKLGSTSY